MVGEPEVGGVIGGEAGLFGEGEDGGLVDVDDVDGEVFAQAEAGEEGIALGRAAAAFDEADVGELEVDEGGGDQRRAGETGDDGFGFGFAEEEGGEGGGIDDLNGRHDRRGSGRRTRLAC